MRLFFLNGLSNHAYSFRYRLLRRHRRPRDAQAAARPLSSPCRRHAAPGRPHHRPWPPRFRARRLPEKSRGISPAAYSQPRSRNVADLLPTHQLPVRRRRKRRTIPPPRRAARRRSRAKRPRPGDLPFHRAALFHAHLPPSGRCRAEPLRNPHRAGKTARPRPCLRTKHQHRRGRLLSRRADLPHRPLSRQRARAKPARPTLCQPPVRAPVVCRPNPRRGNHHCRRARGGKTRRVLRPNRRPARYAAKPPVAAFVLHRHGAAAFPR